LNVNLFSKTIQSFLNNWKKKKPKNGAARLGFVCDSRDGIVLCEAKTNQAPLEHFQVKSTNIELLYKMKNKSKRLGGSNFT
jgi:hypothetical protein